MLGWGAAGILFALIVAGLVAYSTSSNACDHPTAPRGELMKAIVYCEFGSPDVLKLEAKWSSRWSDHRA